MAKELREQIEGLIVFAKMLGYDIKEVEQSFYGRSITFYHHNVNIYRLCINNKISLEEQISQPLVNGVFFETIVESNISEAGNKVIKTLYEKLGN